METIEPNTLRQKTLRLRLKLISCEVLVYAAHRAIIESGDFVSPVFLPKDSHNKPDELKKTIQTLIDEASEGDEFDAILLGYGLCGNSILGLTARSVPLIVPRAHDCCTLFLGSTARFKSLFGENLSTPWTSPGYIGSSGKAFHEAAEDYLLGRDRSIENLAAEYGEENARYVLEMLSAGKRADTAYFITDPEMDNDAFLESAREKTGEEGTELNILEGDARLITGLILGDWIRENGEYLLVRPGERIEGVYDHDQVITAKKAF